MTKTEQAFVSLAIRIVVIGVIAILDYTIKNLTSFGLPDATITVPVIGLVLSESDTWLVNWQAANP